MIDDDGNIVKSVFTSMTLDEISAVDRPAQPGARMSIMKRADKEEDDEEVKPKGKKSKNPFGKRAAMTSIDGLHQHLLTDEVGPDQRSDSGETQGTFDERGDWHSHPWIRESGGSITIGMSDGHKHTVGDMLSTTEKGQAGVPDPATPSNSTSGDSTADSVGKVQQGTIMPETNDQTVDNEAVAKLEALTKRAERAEKVAELNDAQRAIFAGLDTLGQDDFLGLSPDLRDAQVAKAAEANAVVYTDAEGAEFRKSDDPRLVAMAKRADKERELREKGEKDAKASKLAKRAEGFTHIVGGVEAATLILKGIDALPKDDQAPALEALGKQEAALAEAFVRKGTSEVPSAEGNELDAISKAIRTANPTLSPEQAMAKALETPEGSAAYSKSLGF